MIVGDFAGQRAAVGVAEDEVGRAGFVRRLVAGGGVFGVQLVAVEGVLAVEDDFAALCLTRYAIVSRIMARFSSSVVRRISVTWSIEVLQTSVTTGVPASSRSATCLSSSTLRVRAARAAEGGELGVLELELLRFAEELDVLLVGAGPAALDVVHAEGVEALGDAQLVGEGKVDAFALRAVAERGVVKGDWR